MFSVTQAFVMADTTYNSLGVDEVAAQHVNAQCIVSPSDCMDRPAKSAHHVLGAEFNKQVSVLS